MSATKLRDVTKSLKAEQEVHIRRGTPTREGDNKKGVIYAGFEVEITEEWRGERIGDNDLWYRDNNGDFLWSGGFGEEAVEVLEPISSETLDSGNCAKNRLTDYAREITESLGYDFGAQRGENVTVALLDSGIDEDHQDLRHLFSQSIYRSQNFVQSEPDHFDQKGHGTHICGLIAAEAEFDFGIRGLAPECNIWNMKVADKNGNTSISALKSALQFLIETEKQVDIINMSINTHPTMLAELDTYFQQLDRQGIFMVGSANFEDDQLFSRALTPAASEFVISVGSYSDQFKLESGSLHETVDFMLPKVEYCSTSIKGEGYYQKLSGSSMNTAIVTGLLARLISKIGKVGNEKLFRELSGIAQPSSSPIKFSTHNLVKNEKSSCHTRYHT